jgi:hypothetical protein
MWISTSAAACEDFFVRASLTISEIETLWSSSSPDGVFKQRSFGLEVKLEGSDLSAAPLAALQCRWHLSVC